MTTEVIGPADSQYKNITQNDVKLARIYYPILIDLATHKQCLTYDQLVSKARTMHPDNKTVQNAIAVSISRRLDVVRMFTSDQKLPDVSSLAVAQNGNTAGVANEPDTEKTRGDIYAHDWAQAGGQFKHYMSTLEKAVKPRKARNKQLASDVMAKHYGEHKSLYPERIREMRGEIVMLLMEGLGVSEAFDQAQRSLKVITLSERKDKSARNAR